MAETEHTEGAEIRETSGFNSQPSDTRGVPYTLDREHIFQEIGELIDYLYDEENTMPSDIKTEILQRLTKDEDFYRWIGEHTNPQVTDEWEDWRSTHTNPELRYLETLNLLFMTAPDQMQKAQYICDSLIPVMPWFWIRENYDQMYKSVNERDSGIKAELNAQPSVSLTNVTIVFYDFVDQKTKAQKDIAEHLMNNYILMESGDYTQEQFLVFPKKFESLMILSERGIVPIGFLRELEAENGLNISFHDTVQKAVDGQVRAAKSIYEQFRERLSELSKGNKDFLEKQKKKWKNNTLLFNFLGIIFSVSCLVFLIASGLLKDFFWKNLSTAGNVFFLLDILTSLGCFAAAFVSFRPIQSQKQLEKKLEEIGSELHKADERIIAADKERADWYRHFNEGKELIQGCDPLALAVEKLESESKKYRKSAVRMLPTKYLFVIPIFCTLILIMLSPAKKSQAEPARIPAETTVPESVTEMQMESSVATQESETEAEILTGWYKEHDGWKYYKEDGTWFEDEWQELRDKTYFFDDFGYARTGWVNDGGKRYYFNEEDGHLETGDDGWLEVQGDWYYLDPEEHYSVTGWIQHDGEKYYLNKDDGKMVKGWLEYGDDWYYLDDENGQMLHDTESPGGKYLLDSDGKRKDKPKKTSTPKKTAKPVQTQPALPAQTQPSQTQPSQTQPELPKETKDPFSDVVIW